MYPTINHSFLSLFLLLLPGIQPFPYLPLMSPHHARVHPPDTRERESSITLYKSAIAKSQRCLASLIPATTLNPFRVQKHRKEQLHERISFLEPVPPPREMTQSHLRSPVPHRTPAYVCKSARCIYLCACACVYLWSSRRSDTDLIPGAYQRIVPRVFWQIATSLLPICLHASG